MSVQIFSRYKRPLVSGTTFKKPSLTSQEFLDECNINKLLYKYASQAKMLGLSISEVLPRISTDAFRDVSNAETFHESMNRISQMNDLFSNLPSDVRRKYGDTVEGFVNALGDPSQYEYLAEHGVLDHSQVKDFMSYVKGSDGSSSNSSSNGQNLQPEVKQENVQNE